MPSGYRALIVDDDVATQRLTSHALRQQGFQCDCASDGDEAEQMAAQSPYDVVVTELTLPQKNGYAFILELLKSADRPIIVVYTDVIEPRLTKDLLIRGVDDILSKPVHGAFLAGKIRALVERRAAEDAPAAAELGPSKEKAPAPALAVSEDGLPISLTQLNRKLADVASVLPVSGAALDVFEMTRGCDWEITQIAAAIQRDASLAAGVLKLANSHLYNPAGKRIAQLDQAVMRIGQNRVGELALAASTLATVTPEVLPWLDLELAWKRSMAAGLVMEALIEAGGHQSLEEGLLLSATMYPLGRVALGMLFPKEYQEMVAACEQTGETLQEQERRSLPTSHVQVMAHLLASWNIPPEVFLPLKFASDEYSSLLRLSEPLRTKAELMRVAVVLGRLAAGKWHRWDLVQLPSAGLLKRLRVANVAEIVSQAQSDLAKLAEFSLHPKAEGRTFEPESAGRPVQYCNVGGADGDLLVALLPSLGLEPQTCTVEELQESKEVAIVNCLSISPKRFAAQHVGKRALIVTDQNKHESFGRLATTIALPNSFGRVRDGLVSPLVGQDADLVTDRASWISKMSRRQRPAKSAAAEN